jgi:hypothetical protein
VISKIARFVAGLPPSVTRGTKPGVYRAAIGFLQNHAVDLVTDLAAKATFAEHLDKHTRALCVSHPDIQWGTARKCLNIFIRDATYNFYLRRAYDLEAVECELELPLDSFAVKGLFKDAQKFNLSKLPTWKSIISLTCADSACYQQSAAEIARRKRILRVHLDFWYWRAL